MNLESLDKAANMHQNIGKRKYISCYWFTSFIWLLLTRVKAVNNGNNTLNNIHGHTLSSTSDSVIDGNLSSSSCSSKLYSEVFSPSSSFPSSSSPSFSPSSISSSPSYSSCILSQLREAVRKWNGLFDELADYFWPTTDLSPSAPSPPHQPSHPPRLSFNLDETGRIKPAVPPVSLISFFYGEMAAIWAELGTLFKVVDWNRSFLPSFVTLHVLVVYFIYIVPLHNVYTPFVILTILSISIYISKYMSFLETRFVPKLGSNHVHPRQEAEGLFTLLFWSFPLLFSLFLLLCRIVVEAGRMLVKVKRLDLVHKNRTTIYKKCGPDQLKQEGNQIFQKTK